jgi:hypothetical protein
MSDPAALRPGPASCGGVPGSGSALAGWCVVGSDGTGQGTGAVILGEPRRPEVKAGGHPEDAATVKGATRIRFFVRILLPLSRPALITVRILAFAYTALPMLPALSIFVFAQRYLVGGLVGAIRG